jgi:hypothetical protein
MINSIRAIRSALRAITIFVPLIGCYAQTCPPCATNITPMSGHGGAPDGRRIMNISVDSSPSGWGSPVPQLLSDALDQSISQWNDTTDAYGNKTCYFLQRTSTLSNSDIDVEPATVAAGGCGASNAPSSNVPKYIQITRSLISTYDGTHIAQIRGLLDHEIGHILGLAEGVGCASGTTVMTGYYQGSACVQRTYYVQAADIAKSNQNCNNHAGCDVSTASQESVIIPDSTCLSNNACQSQSFYGVPGAEVDTCGYPDNSGCPDYLISVQGSSGPCCTPAYSPLIVDLSGDGFDLTDAAHGVLFDLWGVNDGSKQQVSWTSRSSRNAWLVLDRNGDGTINSGLELFGDRAPQAQTYERNGFRALAEFDKLANGGNGDGRIDDKDQIFTRLRLWIDENHNGISEPAELHTLDEFGITGFSLKTEESRWSDRFGNKFRFRGRIETAPGSKVSEWMYDVFLVM